MGKKYKLDAEEQEILDLFEKDEWVSVLTPERISEIKETAKNTFKQTKRVNIRMSERDFERIQVKALEENIPYQTLIGSLIHKYLDGIFMEKNSRPG
jgi:predicted DNA binding CopG/RHH family protein